MKIEEDFSFNHTPKRIICIDNECKHHHQLTFKEFKDNNYKFVCKKCSFNLTDEAIKIFSKFEKSIKKDYEKKSQEKEDNTIKTSFVELNGTLYEQVKGGKYIYIQDGKVKYCSEIQDRINNLFYKPCTGEEINENKEVVILPSELKDYGTVKDLQEEIKSFIHEWLEIDFQYETFASWFVLLTWVYDKMPTVNYLSALGDTGTGKSRYGDVIGRICYKATIGSGGVTVAAVKRLINKWRGTLIIDEGDFKVSDETAELIKLLNLGFEKNKTMFNCDKNDPNNLEFYDPFCPKIILRRRDFKDKALEARCLTTVMQVMTRKDILVLLPKRFYDRQEELRNKLLKFRFDYYNQIDIDNIINIDLGDIEPRIKQATLSFTTLFSNIPEVLNDFKQFIKEYNKTVIDDRASSFDGLIVNKIIDLIISGNHYINSKDIIESLDNFKTTPATVGKHLKQLGISVIPKFVNGKTKRVISINNKFLEVVKRYCIDQEKITGITDITGITGTCEDKEKQESLGNNKKSNLPVCPVIPVIPVISNEQDVFDNSYDFFVKKTQNKEVLVSDMDTKLKGLTDTFLEKKLKDGDYFEPRPGVIMRCE